MCHYLHKKVIFYNENKIDIQLSAPTLVERDGGCNGLWYVSSYINNTPFIYCTKTAYTQDTSQDLEMYLYVCAGYPFIKLGLRKLEKGNHCS